MRCEQLQKYRATHQKVMDLFHALAFEVLTKFCVIQPYSFFPFPREEEREAINAGVGGVGVFGYFVLFCLMLIHFA